MKLIGTSQITLLSSRWKIACSLTLIATYRSPLGPPLPCPPSPVTLSREPVSTPAGILIERVLVSFVLPLPRQSGQGLSTTLPSPLHWPQVLLTLKKPC